MSATPLKQIGLNELAPTIVALSDAGGTTEHAEWIRKPGNALLVVRFMNGQLESDLNAQFSAPVVYVHPPLEELRRRFPDYVNSYYTSKHFDPIGRCMDVSRESRVVVFEYVRMDRDTSKEEVLSKMDRNGLRPALYEELLGFSLKYPDERRKYCIVALGSETVVNGERCVAFLRSDGRCLDLCTLIICLDHYSFLAVREAA